MRCPWVQKLDRHAAAAMSYSWMRPPSRSGRSMRKWPRCGCGRGACRRIRIRRHEAEGTVGPLVVVVPDADAEDVFKLVAAEDEQAVEAFATDGSDPAFMCAFAFGARTGVTMTLISSLSRR